ncbi:RecA-family ATPase [Ancylobacter sp. 3268]|uniref:AAA family ATPase n=1 Tax=Ancylobacter sp. 3268 TaxID=2817752 RepID=UPI00285F2D75|nr:AAA family ATPase [Ancylobacter sp. 3268]MDR6955219.1 RecA-family ATPase [Ancylobacter sp. 3268]
MAVPRMQANSAEAEVIHLPPRAAIFGRVRQMRTQLYGDVALFPITAAGDFDHEAFAVDGFDWYTGDLDRLPAGEERRLGVFVDSFKRFIPDAPVGVKVAILDRGGDVQVEQVDVLAPYQPALDLVRKAIATGQPLRDRASGSGSLADALTSAAPAFARRAPETFDEICARLEQQFPNLSEKVIERMAHREIRIREIGERMTEPHGGALQMPREAADDILHRLPTIDPAAWAGQPVPEREWFLPGLIPAKQVTLLSGDGGTGKSLLALQLGIASALGVSTARLKPTEGKVLYLAAEDDEPELQRRTVDIARMLGGDLADLSGRMLIAPLADQDATLATAGRDGVLMFTRLFAALERKVTEFQPGLLILDTAADLFAGDEIKRNQVRNFIAALRKLALSGPAVLLLAHPSVSGMQSGTGTSGSTAWSNSVRSRLYLTRPTGDGEDPNARELSVMKTNYSAIGEKVRVRWEAGAFVEDSPLEPAMIGAVHRKHDDKFVELLSKFNRQGRTVSPNPSSSYGPKLFSEHADGRGISKQQFAAAMSRLLDAGAIKTVVEGRKGREHKRLYVTAEMFGGGVSD